MNRNDEVAATLRSLDPADRHVDPTNARARADLQAILATDPTPHRRQRPWSPSTGADRPQRPARTIRRVVLVASMVAAVTADASSLLGYFEDVHAGTLEYVRSLSESDLTRVVDPGWDPPVTMSVRLVSVVADDLQHVGQAAYVRGLLQRR